MGSPMVGTIAPRSTRPEPVADYAPPGRLHTTQAESHLPLIDEHRALFDGRSRRPGCCAMLGGKQVGYRNAQFSSKAAFHNSEASIFYRTGGCDCVAGTL